jgi:hypothetical protein
MVPGIAILHGVGGSRARRRWTASADRACLRPPSNSRSHLRASTALERFGILLEVTELGPVDLASVLLLDISIGRFRKRFLLGGVRDAALAVVLAFSDAPSDTPGTRRILSDHSDAGGDQSRDGHRASVSCQAARSASFWKIA